jgi:hypothetical protein
VNRPSPHVFHRTEGEDRPETVAHLGDEHRQGPARAVATEIDPGRVDVGLRRKVVGGGEHVVNLAEEPLTPTRVIVAASERGDHQHNPGHSIRGGGLVVAAYGVIGPQFAEVADQVGLSPGGRGFLRRRQCQAVSRPTDRRRAKGI